MMVCHRYQGVLIPGCWAVAVQNGDCTCNKRQKREEREDPMTRRIRRLEQKLDKVIAKLGAA